MSSSVYRSSEIRIKAQDKVIIDSRDRAEQLIQDSLERDKLRERRRMEASLSGSEGSGEPLEDEDGFVAGIPGLTEVVPDENGEGFADDVQGAQEGGGGVSLEAVSEEAERILTEAREEAERILGDAGNEAEEIKQRAAEEGRESGYNEGKEAFEEESERLKKEYEDKVSALESEYDRKLREAEPRMAEIITSVYEKVFSCDLQDHRQILLQLIRTGLRDSESSRNFIIHVSEADREAVVESRDALKEITGEGSTVDIIADVTLSEGQALIENDDGIIDCSIDTELKELSARLRILSEV